MLTLDVFSTGKCYYKATNPGYLALSANVRKVGTNNKRKQSTKKVGTKS